MGDNLTTEGFAIEKLLAISDKTGEDVNFTLNAAQRHLDTTLTGRDLVPKARQEGVSSYFLARYLIACLGRRNTKAVVISHDQESTQRMLSKVKYYINHFRGPAPVINNSSANLITFPKNDSMFYIGTAGSRKFGRGDTITHLHCSEYAYWPNPQELIKGLFQAVPMGTGEIAIESTGNGFNDYHRRCFRAYQGASQWTCHFLPWHTFPEYALPLEEEEALDFMDRLDVDLEEDSLSEILTPEQLAWRRVKLEELDYDLRSFRQEYPMTLDECFQASGESVFHRVNYVKTDLWQTADSSTRILEGHPSKEYTYVAGADVGGGVSKDSSVLSVICVETMDQVLEYTNNKLDPEAFAYKCESILKSFGNPYLVVESNNHGILTLAILNKIYPSNMIYRTPSSGNSVEERRLHNLGYRTTVRSKPLMIGRLRSVLAHEKSQGGLTVFSPLLRDQLSTFIEHSNGKMGAQDGCDDDCVMALACAVTGINQAALFAESARYKAPVEVIDPFSFDTVIKEMRRGGERFPVRDINGMERLH